MPPPLVWALLLSAHLLPAAHARPARRPVWRVDAGSPEGADALESVAGTKRRKLVEVTTGQIVGLTALGTILLVVLVGYKYVTINKKAKKARKRLDLEKRAEQQREWAQQRERAPLALQEAFDRLYNLQKAFTESIHDGNEAAQLLGNSEKKAENRALFNEDVRRSETVIIKIFPEQPSFVESELGGEFLGQAQLAEWNSEFMENHAAMEASSPEKAYEKTLEKLLAAENELRKKSTETKLAVIEADNARKKASNPDEKAKAEEELRKKEKEYDDAKAEAEKAAEERAAVEKNQRDRRAEDARRAERGGKH